MRNIIIAILLLTAFTAQSQTKWRQIERSLTKWNVPAAYDSIPGQTGYAGKWINLQTLIDTIGIETGGINGSGVTDYVAVWKSADTITGYPNFTFTDSNTVNIIGRILLDVFPTRKNVFINGGNLTSSGEDNVAIGSNQTLDQLTTGDGNVAIGSVSGGKTSSGNNNTFVGYLTGTENTTGLDNTYIGQGAGYINNDHYNVFLGSQAGYQCTTTQGSVYLGFVAGRSANNDYNVGIGYYNSFHTTNTGTENVSIGTQASQNGGGNYNVKIGTQSGYANTGSNNVFVGQESGYFSSSKGGNIFIGYESGKNEDIDNSLIISNSASTSNGIYGDFDNSKFGLNIAPASAARTWDINGELRIRDLTTDNPTKLLGADNDGDVSGITLGSGLTLTGTTLSATGGGSGGGIDSTIVADGYGINVTESPANTFTIAADTAQLVTPYDLSLVDQSATNELQTISTSGAAGNITLSNGGGTLNLNVNDADSSPTNEIQNITTNGTSGNITISSGSTLTLNVNDADASITNEIQTIDTFQIFDTNKLRISLTQDNQPAKVVTLPTGGGGGIDSTIVNGGWGIDVTESPLNTFTVKSDTAEVATQYDLTLKQDKLVSGTNIKTVNTNSLLGTGNISVGTVTSIGTSAPISGGTITGSGTIGLNYDTGTLTLSGSNITARAGANIWNANQLQNTSIKSTLAPSIGNVLTYTALNQWESLAPVGTNLTFTGSASPYTLESSTGTDVTIAEGTGITLTRSSNQITIASTLTAPQTWGDFTTNIQSWGSTGTFGSGKDVGIGGQPTRDFDVIGDSRLRGAIYNSTNSAGTTGQVLTSNGASAWTWATPADGSATNEAQTLSLSAGTISLSAVSGSGGGSVFIPSYAYGTLYNTTNLTQITFDATARKLDFTSSDDEGTTASTAIDEITITTSGVYKIEYSGSFQFQSPYVNSMYIEIYNNGAGIGYIGECRARSDENAVGNLTSFSRSFITNLSAGDDLSLYYRRSSGVDTTVSFYNINLIVTRIN
jgi:hypothetical protein